MSTSPLVKPKGYSLHARPPPSPQPLLLALPQVMSFRAMYLMADLGDEHTVAGFNEKVLARIRAHPDGSFDIQPGFCRPGQSYRFEDDNGGWAVQQAAGSSIVTISGSGSMTP